MPIVVTPTPEIVTPPTVYRICGISMHQVAEPVRLDSRWDPETGALTVQPAANGWLVVEWEAGDYADDGRFVAQQRGTTRIGEEAFLSYLNDRVGAAIAAMLELYLHQAMVEMGVFPVGQNQIAPEKLTTIASFCGWFLATWQPPARLPRRAPAVQRFLEQVSSLHEPATHPVHRAG
ncbi:MAG: hypothetical protein N2383_03325 [Caldilineales bacterium]|nr:hypothetical protein [Caldilineales bacterium]